MLWIPCKVVSLASQQMHCLVSSTSLNPTWTLSITRTEPNSRKTTAQARSSVDLVRSCGPIHRRRWQTKVNMAADLGPERRFLVGPHLSALAAAGVNLPSPRRHINRSDPQWRRPPAGFLSNPPWALRSTRLAAPAALCMLRTTAVHLASASSKTQLMYRSVPH